MTERTVTIIIFPTKQEKMNNLSFLLLVVLFAVAASQQETIVRKDIKGRPLTPEEGCGYSKVANNRIVGGAPAKNGEI